MNLTPKQEKFCNLYVELGNASQAYRQSYSCSKMKMETINNKAYQMLCRGDIRTRVSELQAELDKKSDYRKEDALKTLKDIATANILDFVQIDEVEFGETKLQQVIVKDLNQLTEAQKKCVKSIQPMRGGGVKVELYSSLDAIDRLSKMLGWDEPTKVQAEIESITVEVINGKDKDQ